MRAPGKNDPLSAHLTWYFIIIPSLYWYCFLNWIVTKIIEPVQGTYRLRKAKRRLKKDGIDHLVDL
jgi:p-aminobenzoyl-glutamate transporter AbgT